MELAEIGIDEIHPALLAAFDYVSTDVRAYMATPFDRDGRRLPGAYHILHNDSTGGGVALFHDGRTASPVYSAEGAEYPDQVIRLARRAERGL